MACFTRQNLKDIYDYMKANYIDKGVFRNDFEGLLKQVGKDLNRDPEEMAKVLAAPKSIRNISNETYLAYNRRRRATANAKSWLEARGDPALEKALNAIAQTTYATRVLGHGPVSFGVHAAPYLYMPTRWGAMTRNYLNAWKNFSDASYEKMARSIENADDFRFWNKHSKGSIDPAQHVDDFQAYADWAAKNLGPLGAIPKGFAELSRRGSQQFQGLKMFRMEMMRYYWDKLKPSQQTDAAADRIGDYVNHMTGVSPDVKLLQTRGGKLASNVAFAPSLEAARWLRMTDVAKTFKDTLSSDPGLRRFAYSRMRDYTEMFATYTSMLELNNAYLAGSGQQVNFNDKDKYDWLLPKRANGDAINLSGGEINTIRFLARELGKQRDPKTGRPLTAGAAAAQQKDILGAYIFGKESPVAGTLHDVQRGSAYGEEGKYRPLPVPWAPPPSKGTTPYSIPEYLAERQSPIPVSGAAQAIISERKKGVPWAEAAEAGIIPFLAEGLFGARYLKK
jgi:hypothetical protein